MTSLSEAYNDDLGRHLDLRRLYLGVALFLAGTALVVGGILAAGTELLTSLGYGLGEARLYGGILGGLGVPAVFLGVFSVLPAGRVTRAAALVGASLAVLGVAMFSHAYPCQWIGSTCEVVGPDLTLPTAAVYFLGMMTTFWCLFVGVANFKTRNDPGGTVTMNVTRKGETKVVEVERSRLGGLGGIGFFGATPDGDVETQTNAREAATGSTSPNRPGASGSPASDGGASTADIRSPLDDAPGAREAPERSQRPAEPEPAGASRQNPSGTVGDRYCGTCAHFDYVRTDRGIQPYCGLHDETMDDMTACDRWSPRGR